MKYKLDTKPIQSHLLMITIVFITNKTTFLGLIYTNIHKISSLYKSCLQHITPTLQIPKDCKNHLLFFAPWLRRHYFSGLSSPKGCFCKETWKQPVSVLVCSRALYHSGPLLTENTACAISTGFICTAP